MARPGKGCDWNTTSPSLVWQRDGVGGCLPSRGPLSRGHTVVELVECSMEVHGLDGEEDSTQPICLATIVSFELDMYPSLWA